MAEVTERYGIDLQIDGFDKFKRDSDALDNILTGLTSSIDKVVSNLNRIDFGKVTFKADKLAVDKGKLDATAKGLATYANSVENLSSSLSANLDERVAALGKALSTGARADTIAAKASGVGKLATQLNKLTSVPRLGGTARDIEALFKSLSAAGSGSSASVDELRKTVNGIVRTLNRLTELDTSKLDETFTKTLGVITKGLRSFDGLDIERLASGLPAFSKGLTQLSKAVRSFASGENIDKLPRILFDAISALEALIRQMRDLANNAGSDVTDRLLDVSKAVLQFSKAIRSFGSDSDSFGNITSNVDDALAAFERLISVFRSGNLSKVSKDIVPVATALGELADAFTSLGRRKGFTEFPKAIEGINAGLQALDVDTLRDLGAKIQEAIGPLRDLAEVATSLRKIESVSKAVKASRDSAIQLRAANVQLAASFIQLATAVAPLIPRIAQLGKTLLLLPIRALTATLKGLRAVFVSFPLKVLTSGFNLITGAIRGTLNIFRAIGDRVRLIDRQFKLITRTINLLLTPFRLLIGVVTTLLGLLGRLASGFGRVTQALNPFSQRTKDAAKNLTDTVDASKNADTVLQGVGQGARDASVQINNYNREVGNTGKVTRVAAGALGIFGAALATRGVSLAIKRLVSLQIALRTLDKLTRLASVAFQQFTQRLGQLVGLSFRLAADFEQLRLSINSLAAIEALDAGQFDDIQEAFIGTTAQADEYLQILGRVAFASPFSRDDIAQGFRLAQVYGFAGDEALGLTQIIVDTAASIGASGAAIKELILPVGQIAATGRASLEDLKQLGERGVPIFKALQDELNLTGAALRENISAGAVSATDVFNALAAIGTTFEGAASRATNTLQGLLATATDLRNNSLRVFFEGAVEPVKELASSLLTLDNIDSVVASARQLGVEFGVRVKAAIETAIRTFVALKAVFDAIPDGVKSTIASVARFGGIIAGVSVGLGLLGTALTFLATTLFVLLNPLNVIIGVVVALGVTVSRNFDGIIAKVNELGQSFLQLPRFLAVLTTSLLSVISTGNTATSVFSSFTGVLQSVGVGITGTVGLVIKLGEAFLQLVTAGEVAEDVFLGIPPTFQRIGNSIASVANFVAGLVKSFVTGFGTIGTVIADFGRDAVSFFQTILTNVTDFGSGLISAFADGIIGALSIVASALGELGNLIAFWLAPGSPPRLLPDIDKWGTAAASEFLGGFTKADFDLIDDFGTTVEQLLRTLDLGDVDTAPIVQEFAEGLAQLSVSGEFDTTAIERIASASGAANSEVASLATKFAELAEEQAALNAATRDYEAALNSAQGALTALDASESISSNEDKIKDLQQTLQNQFITEEEATRTQARIERLQAENRIKALQQAKAEQEALTGTAQEAIDAQKQQLALAQQFGDEGALSALGAGGSIDAGSVKAPKGLDKLKGDTEKALGAVADVFKSFSPDTSKLAAAGESLTKQFEDTKENVTNAFTDLRDRVETVIGDITTTLERFGITANRLKFILVALGAVVLGPQVLGAFAALATVVAPLFTPLGLLAAGTIGATAGFVALAQQAGSIEGAFEAIGGALTTLSEAFSASTAEGSVIDVLSNVDLTSLESVADAIGTISGIVVARVTEFFAELPTTIATLWTGFKGEVATFLEASGGIAGVLANAFGDFGTAINDFLVQPIIDALTTNNQTLLGKVSGALVAYTSGVASLVAGATLEGIRTGFGLVRTDPTLGPEDAGEPATFLSNNVAKAFEDANPAIRIENAIRGWFASIDLVGAIGEFFNESTVGQTIEANLQEFVRNVFGLEGFDVSDSLVGIVDAISGVFTTIRGSLDSFSAGFGEGGGVLSNVLRENAEAFDTFFKTLADPEFQAALGTIAKALGIAAGAVAGLAAAIVDGLLIGLLTNIGDIVIGVANGLNLFGQAFEQLVSGNVIGALVTALQGLGTIFDSVLGGIAQIVADAVKALLEFVGIDTDGPIGTFIDLAANLVATLVPVVGQVGKATGALRALFAVVRNPKGIVSFGKSVVGTVKSLTTFSGIVNVLKGTLSLVRSLFARLGSAVQPLGTFFGTLGKSIGTATGFLNKYLTAIIGLLNPIKVLGLRLGQLSAFFGGVGDFVDGLATDLFGFGEGAVTEFLKGFANGALQVGKFVLDLAKAFIEWLKPSSPPKFLPDIDKWGLDTALEFIIGFVSAPVDGVLTFAKNIGSALIGAFSPSNIAALVTTLVQSIVGLPWRGVADAITQAFLTNVVQPFSSLLGSFNIDLSAIADAFISGLRAALVRVGIFLLNNIELIQRGKELLDRFVAWLNEATPEWVRRVASAITEAFSTLGSLLGSVFGPVLTFLANAGREVANAIAGLFNVELPSFASFLTFVEENISQPLLSIGPKIGQGILDGIKAVFGERTATLVESAFNFDISRFFDLVVPQELQSFIKLLLELGDITLPENPFVGWTLGDVALRAIDFILNPVGTLVNPFLKWFLPDDVANLISILLDVGLAIVNPIRLWNVPANLLKLVRLLTGSLRVTNLFNSLKVPALISKFIDVMSGVSIVNPLAIIKIPEGIQAVVDFFQGRINPFENASVPTPIADFVGNVKDFTSGISNPFSEWTFSDAVVNVVKFITNPIGTLLNPFIDWLFPESVSNVVNLLVGTATAFINPLGVWALPAKLGQVFRLITGADTVSNLLEGFSLPQSVTEFFDFVSQPIANPFADFSLPDSVTSFFDALSGGVSTGLTFVGDSATGVVDSISGPLSNVNDTLFEELPKLASTLATFITDELLPAAGNAILGLAGVLTSGINTVATEWDLSEIVRTVTRFFVSAGITSVKTVASFFGTLLKAFADGVTFLATEVDYGEVLTSISSYITGTLIPGVIGFGKEVGLGLIQGVLDAFGVDSDSLFQSISDSITSAFAPIQDFFDGVSERLAQFRESLEFLNVIPGIDIGGSDVEGEEELAASIQDRIDSEVITVNPEIIVGRDNTDFSKNAAQLISAFNEAYEDESGAFVTDFAAINASLLEQGFTASDIALIAKKAGVEVPAGLAEGLADDEQVLDRAARQLPSDLIMAIKEELGVESPSTVARDQVAKFVVEGLAQGLTSNVALVTTAAETLVGQVVVALQTAVAGVGETPLVPLVTVPSNVVDTVAGTFETLYAKVLSTFRTFATQYSSEAGATYANVQRLTTTFKRDTTKAFEELYAELQEFTEEFGVEFLETLDEVKDAAIDLFVELKDGALGQLTELATKARSKLTALATSLSTLEPQFSSAGKGLGKATIEGISDGVEDDDFKVADALEGVAQAFDENLELLAAWLDGGKLIGQELVNGIILGIEDRTGELLSAVDDLATATTTRYREAGGIQSPSTVWRDQIGIPLVQGVEVGILAYLPSLLATAASVASAVNDGFAAAFASVTSTGVSEPLLSGVREDIETEGASAVSAAESVASDVLAAMVNTLDQSGSLVASALTGSVDGAIIESTPELTAVGTTLALNVTSSVSATGAALMDELATAIAGNAGLVEEALEEVVTSSMTFATDLVSTMSPGVGIAFVTGIVDGINAGSPLLEDAVIRLSQRTVDVARATLGIASPSRVSFEKVGVPFVDGVVNAITLGKDSVGRSVEGLFSTMGPQPVELKYSNLLTKLPTLRQAIRTHVLPYEAAAMESSRQVLAMGVGSTTSNATTNIYNWNVTTTPQRATSPHRSLRTIRMRNR